MAKFEVGDVVVVFFFTGNPVCHNSRAIPELGGDGARGKVLSISRKWVHISSCGTPVRVSLNGEDGKNWFALPVAEAKERHRRNFGGPDEYRTPEFIEQVINNL